MMKRSQDLNSNTVQLSSTLDSPKNQKKLTPIAQICENLYIGPGIHVKLASQELQNIQPAIIINCTSEYQYEPNPQFTVVWVRIPIREGDPISFLENMDKFVECIEVARDRGQIVYLHGSESRSRAPALAAYYMMIHCNKTYREALCDLEEKMQIDIMVEPCFDDILTTIQD